MNFKLKGAEILLKGDLEFDISSKEAEMLASPEVKNILNCFADFCKTRTKGIERREEREEIEHQEFLNDRKEEEQRKRTRTVKKK